MKNHDTFVGTVITAFALVGLWYVHSLNFTSQVGLSPGVFPQFVLALMALCGIAIFFEGRNSQDVVYSININWKKLILVIGAMIIYSYALEYLGFIISTIVFLIATLYLFEEKRLKIIATVPLCTAVLIYYTFTEFFLIPLP